MNKGAKRELFFLTEMRLFPVALRLPALSAQRLAYVTHAVTSRGGDLFKTKYSMWEPRANPANSRTMQGTHAHIRKHLNTQMFE